LPLHIDKSKIGALRIIYFVHGKTLDAFDGLYSLQLMLVIGLNSEGFEIH
jgi:hypothetical protein